MSGKRIKWMKRNLRKRGSLPPGKQPRGSAWRKLKAKYNSMSPEEKKDLAERYPG